jgi:hypothetical protein
MTRSPSFTPAWAQVVGPRPATGRPPGLGLFKQVVMVLMLLRQNVTQYVIADMHGISQPTVSRIYRRLLPIIEQVTCLHTPGELVDLAEGRIVLVDGTDVPTRRFAPAITENYSGKRHRHGISIQIAATLDGTLLAVSDRVPGRRHDCWAITRTGWEEALDGHCWIADPAYLGTSAITPTKRPRGSELFENRREVNAHISSMRSAIERTIAHLKNWKILATGYRARLSELPNIIRIVTRLEFYRLGW